ncbi:MAG TPA: hypothetical protein VIC84_15505 [Blastocatellia bacterium]|jgi:hypothetical protein
MTTTLFIVGIIVALAFAAFRLSFMRVALNMLPIAIGAGYAAYLILIGHPTWAVIVVLISLYVTCPWWEFLDEKVWMKMGVCHGF